MHKKKPVIGSESQSELECTLFCLHPFSQPEGKGMEVRSRAEGRGPGRQPQETNRTTYLAGNELGCALVKPSTSKFS